MLGFKRPSVSIYKLQYAARVIFTEAKFNNSTVLLENL